MAYERELVEVLLVSFQFSFKIAIGRSFSAGIRGFYLIISAADQ
jgi:hypothetical protein